MDTNVSAETELVSFRMNGTIQFNKPIDKDKVSISLGGYEMTMNGHIIMFDFEESRASINEENPSLLHFETKNPDYECFEDLEQVTKEMLKNVTEILRFAVDVEEQDENEEWLDEATLEPIALKELSFILPYDDWEEIEVPEETINNFKF